MGYFIFPEALRSGMNKDSPFYKMRRFGSAWVGKEINRDLRRGA